MNDLLEREDEDLQAPEQEEGSGRGKAASGRRDDQGKSSHPFGSSIDKNLPKGSKLGGTKPKSQGVSTNSNITAGQRPGSRDPRGGALKGGAKKVVNKVADQGLRAAGTAAGGVGEPVAEVVIFAKNNPKKTLWIILIIIGIILFPILIFCYIFFGDAAQKQQGPAQNPLTISKTGPAKATLGQQLVYQITAGYPGSADDMTITDPIPAGTDYVSSAPAGTYDPATRTVTWSAKALAIPLVNPIAMTVSLTLKASQDNLKIANIATVTLTNGVLAGAGSGVYAPPAPPDSCGGKYASVVGKITSLPKNYGDPICNFTKDLLHDLLETQENHNEAFVNFWFITIIPGESGYNPNAWAAPVGSQAVLDAGGAWGLYQMGSSTPPGSPPPAPGKGGPNDRGDVNWEVQTTNAITTNRASHCDFWYWGTYRRAMNHVRTNRC